MKFGKLSENNFLIRLERGEDVLSKLAGFCIKQSISNASIIGLGSVEDVALAHYSVDPSTSSGQAKKYSERSMNGIFEVCNLTGTVGIFDNKPLVHIHVTLSDDKMQAYGGHLVKALVSATLEVTINSYPSSFVKVQNEEIGLKLFELPRE